MRRVLLVACGVALCVIIAAWPQPAGLSLQGQRSLAAAALVLSLWVTRVLPVPVSVLLLVVTLLASRAVSSFGEAVSGFTSPVVAFLFGIFGIAYSVAATELPRRFSLFLLRISRRGPRRLFIHQLLIFCGGAYVVPSAITRSSIMIPVYRHVLGDLDQPPGSRFGLAMMLPHAVLNASASSALLTGGLAPITAAALLGGVSWLHWYVYMAVPHYIFIACAGALLYYWIGVPSVKVTGRHDAAPSPELSSAPPWSRAELKVAAVLAGVVALWVLDFLHGFHPAAPAIAAVAVLLAPKIGVADWRDFLRRVSWSQICLVGGALTLARALVESGAAAWLAARLFEGPAAASLTAWQMAIVIVALSAAVHAIVPNIPGSLAVLIPVLTPMAARVGLHPFVIGFMITMAVDAIIFYPLQSVLALIVHESGYVRPRDLLISGLLFLPLLIALVIVFFLPYWKFVVARLTAS